MSAKEDDNLPLATIEQLILEAEKKIDRHLALIERLTAQGRSKEAALEGLMPLVNALNELAEQKVSLMK